MPKYIIEALKLALSICDQQCFFMYLRFPVFLYSAVKNFIPIKFEAKMEVKLEGVVHHPHYMELLHTDGMKSIMQ